MTGRYITDTVSEEVQPDQLHVELGVVEGYLRILTGADVVEILFEDDPDAGQIDDADAVLAAHVPGAKDIKIHRYITNKKLNRLMPPVDVNFKTDLTIGLFPNVESLDGDDPAQIVYYAEAEQDEFFDVSYADAVVVEDYDYTRDEFDVIRRTDLTISWIMENDDPHAVTKTITTF